MRDLFDDQKFALRDCTDRFDRLGVAYMLSGSMAMAAYAMMRMTNDIDIVVELKPSDARRLIDAFQPDYYVAEPRVYDAISRRRMFNMLHQQTIVKIDCVIKKDTAFQKKAFERRRKIDFAGIHLWVISKEDLIISKLSWAKETKSEMQIRDVAGIIRNGYDVDYVQTWIDRLELGEIFTDAKAYLEQNYVDGHDG